MRHWKVLQWRMKQQQKMEHWKQELEHWLLLEQEPEKQELEHWRQEQEHWLLLEQEPEPAVGLDLDWKHSLLLEWEAVM